MVLDVLEPTITGSYTGAEIRTGTRSAAIIAAGIKGQRGNRVSPALPVRIGIIESVVSPNLSDNFPARTHAAFAAYPTTPPYNGPSRFINVWDCTSGSCTASTHPEPTAERHATTVSWLAAGSIELGQDTYKFPGTNTPEQVKRSGMAPGAQLYFYAMNSNATALAALETALQYDGLDILNWSGAIASTACDPAFNAAFVDMNTEIRRLTDAGVLLVESAGNGGNGSGTCTQVYPSWRSEVVSVGALNSTPSTADYSLIPISTTSSSGPMPIRLHWGGNTSMSGIAITAPGSVHHQPMVAPNSYQDADEYVGTAAATSFSAPIVSGAAALLKNAFSDVGWGSADARDMFANLLILHDGYAPYETPVRRVTGLSSISGVGRLRMHWPSSSNLTAPWAWGWRRFFIGNGQVVSWPVGDGSVLSSAVRQWRWALLWTETDMTSVADIDIEVWNTCPCGPGVLCAPVKIAYQNDYDLRNRINLIDDQVAGKCLQMRAIGYSVPPEGRWVHSADMYMSNTPDW